MFSGRTECPGKKCPDGHFVQGTKYTTTPDVLSCAVPTRRRVRGNGTFGLVSVRGHEKHGMAGTYGVKNCFLFHNIVKENEEWPKGFDDVIVPGLDLAFDSPRQCFTLHCYQYHDSIIHIVMLFTNNNILNMFHHIN